MILIRWFIVAALLALAVPAQAGPRVGPRAKAPRMPTLALVELDALGVDEDTAVRVQRELRAVLADLPGYRLLSPRVVRNRLARKKIPQDAPLSRLLGALRARYVVTGTMGGLAEEVSLDLKLLEGGTGREIRRVSDNLPAGEAERRDLIEELLVQLLVPDQWVGALALDVSESGAAVHLDGKQVATTPLDEPLIGLKPGKHILRITKEGFDELSKFVLVRYNQVARLKVDMNNAMVVGLIYERKKPEAPAAAPPPKPAAPPAPSGGDGVLRPVFAWTSLGLGAGAAGTGLYLLLDRDNRVTAPILVASGGLLLAGSLVLFLIDGSAPEAPKEASPVPGITLVPAAVPGGATLGLGGRF